MGSKGGNSSSSNNSGFSASTSTYTPNPEAMAAFRRSLGMAENVTSQPFQPYQGQMQAGFTPDQMNAMQGVRDVQGIYNPYGNTANRMLQQAVNYSDPRSFSQTSLNQYMNPYQNEVVDATMANLAQMNAQQEQGARKQAAVQGTFGGSGEFLGRAEIARQQGLANAQTLAGLRSSNYQQAVQQYNQQQQQAVSTAQNAAYGLGQLGQQAQNAAMQGIQALMTSGGQQQALAQQQLQGAYQQWQAAQAFPYQQAAFYAGIANGIAPNMGGTTNTQGYNVGSSESKQSGGGGGAAGALTSLSSLLPMMFGGSDKDDKTDIKYLGKDDSGEKLYEYRYKGDPKSYPKVVGPMAQDIEEHSPERVREVGGHKVVAGLGHLPPSLRDHLADGGASGQQQQQQQQQSGAQQNPISTNAGMSSNAGLGSLDTTQNQAAINNFIQGVFDPRTADQMARAKWVNQDHELGQTPIEGDSYVIPPSLMDNASGYPYTPPADAPRADGGRVGYASGGFGSPFELIQQGKASGPFAQAPDNFIGAAAGLGSIIPKAEDIGKKKTWEAANNMMEKGLKDAMSGGKGGGGGGGGGGGMPEMKMPKPKAAKTAESASAAGTDDHSHTGSEGGIPSQPPGFEQTTPPDVTPHVDAAPEAAAAFTGAAPEIPHTNLTDFNLGLGGLFSHGGRVGFDGGGAAGGAGLGGMGMSAPAPGSMTLGESVLGDAKSPAEAAGFGDLIKGQETLTGEKLLGKWNAQRHALHNPGPQLTPKEQGMPDMPNADFYTKPRTDLPSVLDTKYRGAQNPGLDTNVMAAAGAGAGKAGQMLGPIAYSLAGSTAAQNASASAEQAQLKAQRESMLKDPANFPVQGYYQSLGSNEVNPDTGLFNIKYTGAYRGYPYKDGGRVAKAGGGGFYENIYSALLSAAKERGVPHPETLARLGAIQAIHESGGGKHAPGHNYFGIKGPGGTYATHENVGGKDVSTRASFRGYPTMQASAEDYIRLMSKPRYKNVLNAENLNEAIAAQAHSGYATDPKYGQKLAAIAGRQGAPFSVQTASTPQPSVRPLAFKPLAADSAPKLAAGFAPSFVRSEGNMTPAQRGQIAEEAKQGANAARNQFAREFNRGQSVMDRPMAPAPAPTPARIQDAGSPPAKTPGLAFAPAPAKRGFSWSDLNPIGTAHAEPAPPRGPAAPTWNPARDPYGPGLHETRKIETDFGNLRPDRLMLPTTPDRVGMQDAPLTSYSDMPEGKGQFSTITGAEAPNPVTVAEPPVAEKRVAPAPEHHEPTPSGQKYWGDWRDVEPFKSDPIGGFFDSLSNDTPQASKPGTLESAQGGPEFDLFSRGGRADRAGGGALRIHRSEGGDAGNPLEAIGEGLGGLGDVIGSGISGIVGGLGGLFDGGDAVSAPEVETQESRAPAATVPASSQGTAPAEEGFIDRWSHNPLSQALFAAGLGMMASPRSNVFQAIGEGGLQGMQVFRQAKEDEDERKTEQTRLASDRAVQELLAGGPRAGGEVAPERRSQPAAPAARGDGASDYNSAINAKMRELRYYSSIPTSSAAQRAMVKAKTDELRFEIAQMQHQADQMRVEERATREEARRLKEEERKKLEASPEYKAKAKQADIANEALEKESVERQQAALAADSKIANYTQMRDAVSSGKFYTGPGAESGLPAMKVAAGMGLADEEGVALAERFQQQAAQSVVEAMGGKLGAGISNADVNYMQRMVPDLGKTKAGNVAALNAAIKIEERKKEIAAFERDYIKRKGYLDANYREELQKWSDAHPLFPSEGTKTRTIVGSGIERNTKKRVVKYSDGTVEYAN